jgi:phosphatidylethanolamine/phosphatidyl-N-methylethanolamine N-methyltransferase
MSATEAATFFKLWMRRPLRLAAANPSGAALADAVATQLDLRRPGAVIELGGGTGGITQGLVRRGCGPERLVVIEREPELAAVLRRRFPELRIVTGDATRLASLLRPLGLGPIASVVSTLPIKWFPRAAQAAIAHQSLDLVGPDGQFLQLTNAFVSPLPRRALGLEGEEVARVWRNFLPAQIWSYRRGAAARGA